MKEGTPRSTDAVDVRDHVARARHGHARQPRRHDRAAGHPQGPAREPRGARVDGQRLHPHVRRAALDRRSARRPLRAPADVRDRARRSSRSPRRRPRSRPSMGVLVAARAVQGGGGAIVMPLTLTILSAAVPAERRGVALGAWGGIGGLAVALGPLVGGAVVSGLSWQWIFWINVPIGLVLIPLALRRLDETRGPSDRLDLPGVGLVSAGLLGIVWGLVRGNGQGWTSPEIVPRSPPARSFSPGSCSGSCARPRRCCRCASSATATFAMTNLASLLMFFGMFGSIFLLAQFFQTVQGYSPLRLGPADPAVDGDADLRRADRRRPVRPDRRPADHRHRAGAAGGRARLDRGGLTPTTPYAELVAPFVISGIGMGLFFAPVANVVLSAVRPRGGGPGVGREQRDPRAGRRLRRRRARLDLLPLRRLRDRRVLRRRADPGDLGRRGRGRGRRARSAAHPAAQAAGRESRRSARSSTGPPDLRGRVPRAQTRPGLSLRSSPR